MTQHKHLKQLIRERQKKTGETYSTARMNVLAQFKAQMVPRQNSSGDGVLPAAKAAATHKATMVVTSLATWVAVHRLDAAALEQLEARAITDSGRSVDMDKLAACAKAVLIAEMINGISLRSNTPSEHKSTVAAAYSAQLVTELLTAWKFLGTQSKAVLSIWRNYGQRNQRWRPALTGEIPIVSDRRRQWPTMLGGCAAHDGNIERDVRPLRK